MGARVRKTATLWAGVALVAVVCTPLRAAPSAEAPWRKLAPGLELASFSAPVNGDDPDAPIAVLRIDPLQFELRLLMSSATPGGARLTAREWCENNSLVAAVNAGMYQEDFKTSVSLMKSRTHVNNAHLTRHRAVLAFDRLDGSVPPVQIIDRDLQPYDDLAAKYGSLVQGIRMVALDGRNVWAAQEERYSVAAVGVDRDGKVLFVHSRGRRTPHDLVDALLRLPLNLRNAMYLEGGPIAQLFVQVEGWSSSSRAPSIRPSAPLTIPRRRSPSRT